MKKKFALVYILAVLLSLCGCAFGGPSSEIDPEGRIKASVIFDDFGKETKPSETEEAIWQSNKIKGLVVKTNPQIDRYKIVEGNKILFEVKDQLFAGDFNHDGYDDLIMNNYWEYGTPESHYFAVYDVHNHKMIGSLPDKNESGGYQYYASLKDDYLYVEKTYDSRSDFASMGSFLTNEGDNELTVKWNEYDFKVINTTAYISDAFNEEYVHSGYASNESAIVSSYQTFVFCIEYEHRGVFKSDTLDNLEITIKESPYYRVKEEQFKIPNTEWILYALIDFNGSGEYFSIDYEIDGIKGSYPVHLDNNASYWPQSKHTLREIVLFENELQLGEITEVRYETYTHNEDATKITDCYFFDNPEEIASFYNLLNTPIEYTLEKPRTYRPSEEKIIFYRGKRTWSIDVQDNIVMRNGHYFVDMNVEFSNPSKSGIIIDPKSYGSAYTCSNEQFVNNVNLSNFVFSELEAKPEGLTDPVMYIPYDGQRLYLYDTKTIEFKNKFYETITEQDFSKLFSSSVLR